MAPSGCVGERELQAYLLGDLAEARAEAVALHLDGCPRYGAHAGQFDARRDPLLRSLQRFLGPAARPRADAADDATPPHAPTPGAPPGSVAGDELFTRAPEGASPILSGGDRPALSDLPDEGEPPPAGGPSVPRVAGYEILGELGRGGMGVVYKARQTKLNRVVALKMILAGGHAGEEKRQRFLGEAEAVARLHHANIVQIYEVGEADDLPFFTLEFVPGGSLAAKLSGTPLQPQEAARVVEQLAGGVHDAHRKGIVHRDLKPANVLLAEDGTPKVTDFGLAKRVEVGSGLTASGAILGTPSYMAPEQASGEGKHVGPTADVYALGAILYECLTGRPPFRAALMLDTVLQVLSEEPVSVRQLQPGVPADLETVCHRCLQKEPARRYASAEELAEDLRRFRAGEPIKARRTPWHERTWRWCRRNPTVATLLGAVALLLLLLTAGTLVKNAELRGALKQSDDARREATDALWVSFRDQAQAVRFSGRQGQRFEGLRAIHKALQQPVPAGHSLDELRTEAIACLSLPDLEVLREWEGRPNGDTCVAADERLGTYVRFEPPGQVSVRRVVDDEVIARLKSSLKHPEARLSPDGRFLLLRGDMPECPLEVWSLTGAKPKLCLSETSVVFHCEAFSADSRRLAYLRSDGMMMVHALTTGPVGEWRLPGVRMDWALAFHPDGQRLAVGVLVGRQPAILVCDVTTGAVTARLPHAQGCLGVAWHPDGRRLAVGCEDGRIHLWDAFA